MAFTINDVPTLRRHYQSNPTESRQPAQVVLDLAKEAPFLLETDPVFKELHSSVKDANRDGMLESFGKGFLRGLDTSQASLYGAASLIGDAIGSEAIRDFGAEGFKRNMEEAQENAATTSFEDLKEGDLAGIPDFIAGAVGEAFPSLLTTLIPAVGAGAGVASLAGKKLLFKTIQKEVAQEVAKKAAKKNLSKDQIKNLVERSTKLRIEKARNDILKGLTNKGLDKQAKELVKKQVTEKEVLQSLGKKALFKKAAAAGTTFSSVAQNSGEIFGRFVDDFDDPEVTKGERIFYTALGGTIAGMLDSVLPKAVMEALSPAAKQGLLAGLISKYKVLQKEKPALAAMLAPGAVGVQEGATEALQELVGIAAETIPDESFDFKWDEVFPQMLEAGVKGGVGGGGIGVGIGTIPTLLSESTARRLRKEKEASEDNQRAVQELVNESKFLSADDRDRSELNIDLSDPRDVLKKSEATRVGNAIISGRPSSADLAKIDLIMSEYGGDGKDSEPAQIILKAQRKRLEILAEKVDREGKITGREREELLRMSSTFPEEVSDLLGEIDVEPASEIRSDKQEVVEGEGLKEYLELLKQDPKFDNEVGKKLRRKLSSKYKIVVEEDTKKLEELLRDRTFNPEFDVRKSKLINRLKNLYPRIFTNIQSKINDEVASNAITDIKAQAKANGVPLKTQLDKVKKLQTLIGKIPGLELDQNLPGMGKVEISAAKAVKYLEDAGMSREKVLASTLR